jgi:hypothetical protein
MALVVASGYSFASDEPLGIERVARLAKPGYQCTALRDDEALWVQVDLGRELPIDQVKLLPAVSVIGEQQGYPLRFRIESSTDEPFSTPTLIASQTDADVADPGDKVGVFAARGIKARYVRLTATKLREKVLWLAKLEVWSGGQEVAQRCPASDSRRGNLGVTLLTRPARPQGEYVVTDNPANMIPAAKWKPVRLKAHAPVVGVRMEGGVLKQAMENNIGYLLATGTPDQLLKYFRDRAGKPNPPGTKVPDASWEHELTGSYAGRFLMGAGSTLRFMEHAELRKRLNQVVNGIEECRRDDGYIMAYPDDTIFYNERGCYTRSWVTQGLIEAGRSGNEKAFPLLRGFYDWFDQAPFLPELLRRGGFGIQGFVASTLLYSTPAGDPKDLLIGQRYFQENYWLDRLARKDPTAIWRYPYSHPHSYLLTAVEPYLDLYLATGQPRYLKAAEGAWQLYHENWEHIGGSIAICEGSTFPPKSYVLTRNTGELCGNTFWARFSERFHLLNPEDEKYPAEIEKSIYNVALPNQATSSIRYTAKLVGKKVQGGTYNSCCEGQGTRFYGTMPEYVYSIADDGLYVNQFAASSIHWKQNGHDLEARMITDFPFGSKVELRVSPAQPVRSAIRVRVPGWAPHDVAFVMNRKTIATGKPGQYITLNRTWTAGDAVSFELPLAFKLTRYTGMEEVAAGGRYALEYGPILMALTGGMENAAGTIPLALNPDALLETLMPIPGMPLHFAINGDPKLKYIPYWEVADENFTCFPVLTATSASPTAQPGQGNLALASLGTTVTADSELATERGCTAQAIDGIIASEGHPFNRWHASVDTTNPHWIQVKLHKPERIGRVVIRFAKDPLGYPLSFQGLIGTDKADKVLFDQSDYPDWKGFELSFPPVTADTFRLVIRESANLPWPRWSNHVSAAQISEIELYHPVSEKKKS